MFLMLVWNGFKIRLGKYLRLFERLVDVDNWLNYIVLLKKDNVIFLIIRDILIDFVK